MYFYTSKISEIKCRRLQQVVKYHRNTLKIPLITMEQVWERFIQIPQNFLRGGVGFFTPHKKYKINRA